MAVYGPVGSEELYHYGIPRKSGRYPYGSGKEPYQDDPKKRRLNKDESAPKATSKRPQSIWAKHRAAQAAKKAMKEREAKKAAASKPEAKVKSMSDDELRRVIARMNLEQEYMSKISKSSKTKSGSDFIKKTVSTADTAAKFIGSISKITAGSYAAYVTGKKFYDLLMKEAKE